jgi:hypothetical protein
MADREYTSCLPNIERTRAMLINNRNSAPTVPINEAKAKLLDLVKSKSASDGIRLSDRYCLDYLDIYNDKIIPTLQAMKKDILDRKPFSWKSVVQILRHPRNDQSH